MRYFTFAVFIALAVIPAAAAAQTSTPQDVTTGELQRYIYQASYPTWCGSSQQAAAQMRVKPTTDPAFLHSVMKANITQCANTSYAQNHAALWNTAVFSAASAALLAARHEPMPQAMVDAKHARNWSTDLAGFVHTTGPGVPGNGPNVGSVYRTNATRIQSDADALIETYEASASTGSPDQLPDHVGAPGGQAGTAGASPAPAATP